MNPTEQKEQGESSNVVPFTGTSVVAKPDPLLEELNVVRLEGRYFSFDKHEAKNKTGIYEFRDGNRGIVIETNPRYGQPSIIAYKVLQAVFRKITLEGRPYPETVAFSYRELARLIGRDVMGGRDSKQLITAIRQLRQTTILLYLYDENDKKLSQFGSKEFSLVITTGLIGEGKVGNPRLKAAVLTVHPVIMDSMRQGHFAIFNWTRLVALEPIAAAMYKRLYLHLSNLYENKHTKDSLKFEKLYEDICGEWLGGLKPERYKSRIVKQLGVYLDALQNSGLIRSFAIEKAADQKSFKLVFKPGKAFFYDYDHFYRKDGQRLLQFQEAADRVHLKSPSNAVRSFYQLALNADERTLDEMVFSEKDIAFARQMIDQFGEDSFLDLIKYAVNEAPKTKFTMTTIGAVKIYIPAWQTDREARTKRMTKRRDEESKRQQEIKKEEYENFRRQAGFAYLERCSPEEREEIRQIATLKVDAEYPEHHQMRSLMLTVSERALIEERCSLPDFETWLEAHS